MKYVKTPEEATEFLLSHIATLQKKCDEDNPVPQKLDAYPTHHILSYGLTSIDNHGNYNYNSYGSGTGHTAATAENRFKQLNQVLDDLLKQAKPIHESNLKKIEHNQKVVARITLLMTAIGIPSSYSEVDTKSRARNTKYITQQAGYLQDIRRNVPTVDTYSVFENNIKKVRANLQTWYRTEIEKIRAEEKIAREKALEEKKTVFLATMRVKYKLAYDADKYAIENALSAVGDDTDYTEFEKLFDTY